MAQQLQCIPGYFSCRYSNEVSKITRRKLLDFRERLKENRVKAEADYAGSSFELLKGNNVYDTREA